MSRGKWEIPERLFLPCLLVLTGVLLFYRLGARDLWERAESEVPLGARDMLETGRWAVPYLLDHAFVDNRPPGIYWAVAASYAATGHRDVWAARLPAALAGLATVLLVFAIGKRAGGATAGFLAGLALLGTFKFAWQSRVSESDAILMLWTLLGSWAFWRSLRMNGGGLLHVVLFQLFVGLGGLTKGPGIVITLLVPLAAWVILSGRWRDVRWLAYVATSPIAAVLLAAWYVYVLAATGEKDQLVLRFTSQAEQHVRGFFYYASTSFFILGAAILFLPPLLAVAFRWTAAAAARAREAVPAPAKKLQVAAGVLHALRDELRAPLGYFLLQVLVQLAEFHALTSKQTHYLVPLLPALCLVIGLATARLRLEEGRYFRIAGAIVAPLLPLFVLGWMFLGPRAYRPESTARAWIAVAVLAAIATWAFAARRAGEHVASWRAAWIGGIFGLAVVLGDIIPVLDRERSSRPFAEHLAGVVPREATIGVTSNFPGLPFYLERPAVLVPLDGTRQFLEGRPDRYLVVETDEKPLCDVGGREPFLTWPAYRHKKLPAYVYRGGPPLPSAEPQPAAAKEEGRPVPAVAPAAQKSSP